MADRISRSARSRIMRRVRSKDTGPEMRVRSLVHELGYRYRLHRRDLPGTPDLVFARQKKVIFVHGCFWHQHNCRKGVRPSSNVAFWNRKFDGNVQRDKKSTLTLEKSGWSVLVIWECETTELDHLAERVEVFLGRRK